MVDRVLAVAFVACALLAAGSCSDAAKGSEQASTSSWSRRWNPDCLAKYARNVTDRSAGVPKRVPKAMQGRSPFRVFRPRSQIFCVNPKVGTSRWFALFQSASGIEFRKKNISKNGETFSVAPVDKGKNKTVGIHNGIPVSGVVEDGIEYGKQLSVLFGDPSVPRFMLVRNPYARVVSGYLNKIVNHHGVSMYWKSLGLRKDMKETIEDFTEFLEALVARKNKPRKKIDRHFAPQSGYGNIPAASGCYIKEGFQYDYILKVEDMQDWAADYIVLNGMEEYTRTGWNKDGRFGGSGAGEEPCYYTPPGKTCEQFYAEDIKNACRGDRQDEKHDSGRAGQISTRQAFSMWDAEKSGHYNNADSKVQKFFASEHALALAYELYRDDLETFGYPQLTMEDFRSGEQ